MKFGHLIEYNMIFLEKSYTKYDGETSPIPFIYYIETKLLTTWFYLILSLLKTQSLLHEI